MDGSGPHDAEHVCPDDAQLALFAGGNLPLQQIDQLAAHVENCAGCQAKLEELDSSKHSSIDNLVKADAAPLAFAEEWNQNAALKQLEGLSPADLESGSPGGFVSRAGTAGRSRQPAFVSRRIGAYELVQQLGAGAMGAVFKCRHVDFGTMHALKLVHPRKQDDQKTVERFRREMEAVGQLDHPNIVRAIDAGEEGGVQYLVMEYVQGIDLHRLSSGQVALGVAESCELVRQAALGLEHAHQHGRVHRDVKPSNLILGRDGMVKLLDLGLARLMDTNLVDEAETAGLDEAAGRAALAEDLSLPYQVMGTLGYIAPEQAADSHAADARADIYSLGCTLYKLLAGRAPFEEPQYSTALRQIMAHAQSPVPPIREKRPEVPQSLADVLERMLAKNPDERFATAAEVAGALEPFARGADLGQLIPTDPESPARDTDTGRGETRREQPVTPAMQAPRRSWARWIPAALVSAALLLIGLSTVWYTRFGARPPEPQTANGAVAPTEPGGGVGPTNIPVSQEPVDLLKLIDLERDAPKGHWSWADGALVCEAKPQAILQIAYSVPESYRIEAKVERLEGLEGPSFGIMAEDQQCLIAFDNFPKDGYLSGPVMIDGVRLAEQSQRAHRGALLNPGVAVSLACTVKKEAGETVIIGEADGEQIFTWRGSARRIAATADRRPPAFDALFLRIVQTKVAFRELRIIPLQGRGGPIEFASPQTQPELAAAQRGVWKGGRLTILRDGRERNINRLRDIPADVQIQRLELPTEPWFSLADLPYYGHRPELRELDLSGLDLADSRVDLSGLVHLETLRLSGAQLTAAQVKALRNLQRLRTLDLNGASIGDDALETIVRLPGLEELRLSETAISDAGAVTLVQMPHLVDLTLDFTAISDNAVEAMAGLGRLSSVSLNGTGVTDAIVPSLLKLASLRRVSLLGTKLTLPAVERLRRDRPDCQWAFGDQPLNLLDYADVQRSGLAGTYQMIAGQLHAPAEIPARLRLPIVPPDEYDLNAIVTRRSGSSAIVFPIVVGGRQTMVGFDHYPDKGGSIILNSVDGQNEMNSEVKSQGIAFPLGREVRMQIRVRRNHIAVLVSGQTRLEWRGDFSRLSENAWYGIGDTRTLGMSAYNSRLAISDWTLTPVTGQADIVPLGPTRSRSEHELAKRIQSLGGSMEITRGGLTPESLDATIPLPEEPFWVREITVPAESRLTSDFFDLLRRTSDLRVLQLNGTAFEASHFAQLRDLKWLGRLELNETPVTGEDFAYLARLPRLDTLALQRTPPPNDALWEALTQFSSLRSLDLSDAQIGDEAAEHLSAMSGLRKLNLSGTRIASATVEAIRTLTNLIELDLSRTAVTEDARESLAELAELRRLNLKDTGLGFQAVERLRQSLPDCVIEGPAWGFLIGKSEPLRPMVPSGEPVDLLALIDLERDAAPGMWEFDGETLISTPQGNSILAIPYLPPGEYRLEAIVERLEGKHGIQLGMVAGNQFFMELDGYPNMGYLSGPWLVDRLRLGDLGDQSYRGQIIPDGKPVRVSCVVLQTQNRIELRVSREGNDLFAWRGTPSSLSLASISEAYIAPGILFLRVWASRLRISELRLIPISGTGQAIRFADPAENPELAAAQRVLWKGGRVAIDVAGKTQRIDTFSALPAQFTIREIDSLGLPSFTSSDLHWFRNLPHLRGMAIRNVPLYGADSVALTELPTLESLVLQAVYLDMEAASHLRRLPQLRRLDLSGAVVDDEAFDVIGQMAGLRELRLDSSRISDDGLAKLAELGNLTLLHLDATSVTDRGIETLRAMPNLTELSLQGTSVGDAATDVLSSLTSLRTLRLLDTAMTAPAVARLEQQLPKCRISAGGSEPLDLLQVADPISGSIHGAWRIVNGALLSPIEARMAAKFRLPIEPPEEYDLEMTARRTAGAGTLVCVILAGDRRTMVSFDHHGGHVILQQLDGQGDLASQAKRKWKSLLIGEDVRIAIQVRRDHIMVVGDDSIQLDWRGEFGRLGLHGYWSPGVGKTLGLASYNSAFAISRLVLKPVSGSVRFDPRHPSPPVHDRWVAARVLELGGFVRIAHGGTQTRPLAPGTELPNHPFHVLEISGLGGNELTEEDFRRIGRLGQLQILNLERAKFDATHLGMLAPLTSLQTLNLTDTSVTDQEVAKFSALTSLRELRLVRTAVTGETFRDLTGLRDLQMITLGSSKRTLEGLGHLLRFPQLRNLDVAGLKLTDDDLALFAEASNLRALHVGWSKVTGTGLVHLGSLPNLEHLNLSGAPLTDEGLAGAQYLRQIHALLLAKTPITDDGLAHLTALPQLLELDLSGTKVTEQGALMLLKHLPKCVILLDGKRLTQPSYER